MWPILIPLTDRLAAQDQLMTSTEIGLQQHTYPHHDFTRLPIRPVAGATGREVVVQIPFPGREVSAKAWLAQVGRVPLILLDTDIHQNDPSDRPISSILYVRGRDMRLAQELVLGIGGVRVLEELGIEPEVWHLNEGHSALLQFERMRQAAQARDLDLAGAIEAVKGSTVFTTHTPVPAGNEVFERGLVSKYLAPWREALGASEQDILTLGSRDGHGGSQEPFNLTALAIRTSRSTNAVSRLHGEVSNDMWRHLFEGAGPDAQPVTSVTNGVHVSTWLGMETLEVFNRHLGSGWQERGFAAWDPDKIVEIPDEEIWTAHLIQKRRLAHFVRRSVRNQFTRHGHGPDELRQLEAWLHEDHFTIGFARRFATYKRADLLFRDIHRLRQLVLCLLYTSDAADDVSTV